MIKNYKFNLIISLIILFSLGCISNINNNNNRNYDLYSKIMCPVCDGQTIGESQASISNDMKNIIDLQISEGKEDEEILGYFEERYGTEILASPPGEGFNIIVWIAPVVLIATAFIVFLSWLKFSTKEKG
ncbi:MAG: cytochrome c-type biogenesis protein CcmH [Dehalococcoidia bacterium]|tara:strand:+ start:40 stop:429 length:390 start_codon:yes stop_codon:yes gene_type:complete